MSRPTAVLLDLDDTLMPEMDAIRAAFGSACDTVLPTSPQRSAQLSRCIQHRARDLWRRTPHAAYCQTIGFSSWEGLWGDASDAGLHHDFFRRWQPVYRHAAWTRALLDVGIDDACTADSLSRAFRRETRARLLPYDGARDAITELRRRYVVGLLTNGESAIQREKIASAGFAGVFDAVVVSGDIGIGKPSQEPFRHMLTRLGVTASESVMVGNSVRSDVLGAQRIGMRAVLVGEADAGSGVSPDAVARGICDVPSVLDGMG